MLSRLELDDLQRHARSFVHREGIRMKIGDKVRVRGFRDEYVVMGALYDGVVCVSVSLDSTAAMQCRVQDVYLSDDPRIPKDFAAQVDDIMREQPYVGQGSFQKWWKANGGGSVVRQPDGLDEFANECTPPPIDLRTVSKELGTKVTFCIPEHTKVPDSFTVRKLYRAIAKDKSGREVCDEEEWSTIPGVESRIRVLMYALPEITSCRWEEVYRRD